MRPFRLLACLIALSVFAVPFVAAQTSTPTPVVFVPLVIVGEPPPPPILQPTGECAQNAPAPEEGAQAWVTNGSRTS